MRKILDYDGLSYFWGKLKNAFIHTPINDPTNGLFLKYTTSGTIWTSLPQLLVYKGCVPNYEALPSTGNTVGDVWTVTALNNAEYFWNSDNLWEDLGTAGSSGNNKYIPADALITASATTMALGGVPAGKTALSFKDNNTTLSLVFDMLLFPTYAPQYKWATLSHTITNEVSPGNVFVGSASPGYSAAITTTAYTYTGNLSAAENKVYGGTVTAGNITLSKPAGSSVTTSAGEFDKLGTYTYSNLASMAAGTDIIKDSKGNSTTGIATNATTLAPTTTRTSGGSEVITSDYKIKELSVAASWSNTFYAYYPIYVYKTSEETSLSISEVASANSNNGVIIQLGAKANAYILVPTGYKVNKLLLENSAGQYIESSDLVNANHTFSKTTTTFSKTLGTQTVTYEKWAFTAGTDAEANYKLYITKNS